MRSSIVAFAVLGLLTPGAALAQDESPKVAKPPTDAAPPESSGYVTPHVVPYGGGAIPASAHIETKPDMVLVGTGIAVTGAAYFFSIVYALSTCGAQTDCRPGSGFLYVPVLGPFMTAAQSLTTGGTALAVFDGGVQALGAALAIAGIVSPKKFVVWQDKTASVTVTPTLAASGAGGGLALTLLHL